MDASESLFFLILRKLHDAGILQDIVLIGSWALPIYRDHFGNDPRVPVLRTTDIDLLIPRPSRIHREVDIPAVLSDIGLEPAWSPTGDHCKYVHPEIEVEFLTPEFGRGDARSIEIPKLRIKAQPLRYLGLAAANTTLLAFHDLDVRVPLPEAFLLLKILVIPKRLNRDKAAKDRQTARELGDFMLADDARTAALVALFDTLPGGWKKTVLGVTADGLLSIYKLLVDSDK